MLNPAPLPQPALTLATDKMDSAGGLWPLRSPWAQGGLRLLQTVRSGTESRHSLSSSPSTLASNRALQQKHEVLMLSLPPGVQPSNCDGTRGRLGLAEGQPRLGLCQVVQMKGLVSWMGPQAHVPGLGQDVTHQHLTEAVPQGEDGDSFDPYVISSSLQIAATIRVLWCGQLTFLNLT